MLSGPLVFIFYLGPLYSKFKKKSPAQLSPSTSYLNIIWSATTPNGSFSFPLFSLSFLLFSSLFSLSFFLRYFFSFFLTGASIQSTFFCSQRMVFLYIWRPNPPDRWYTVCSQKVDLGLSRIWVFVFIFNYMLMIIECM